MFSKKAAEGTSGSGNRHLSVMEVIIGGHQITPSEPLEFTSTTPLQPLNQRRNCLDVVVDRGLGIAVTAEPRQDIIQDWADHRQLAIP
jgi:hypothetical protein